MSARNLHPATGEEPRVRSIFRLAGTGRFQSGSRSRSRVAWGKAVTFAVARRDRSVPEVMAFQTKSLGDGVYRLSPFTSGAYEIFAQVRGAAPLKALVNRVTRQIEFPRQGKQEAFTADLVIGVRKGTGVASPTVGGPHPTHDLGRFETTDNAIRIGVQKGRPPGGTQSGDAGAAGTNGRATTGVQEGGAEDAFEVFIGGDQYSANSAPVWVCRKVDGLKAPTMSAVEEFRKAVEETEKAIAQKQKQKNP